MIYIDKISLCFEERTGNAIAPNLKLFLAFLERCTSVPCCNSREGRTRDLAVELIFLLRQLVSPL